MGLLGIAPETWFPVVTLIIGALLKGCFDALMDGRIARREAVARREQRLDNIRLKRTEVQREALLELQSFSMRLARGTGRMHHHDLMAHHETGEWHKRLLPEDLNSEILEAQVGIVTRRVRVRDATVRRLADAASTACNDVVFSKGLDSSNHALWNALSLNKELQERIGEVLRKLDDDEESIAGNVRGDLPS